MKAAPADLLLLLRGAAAVTVVLWHGRGWAGEWPALVNTPGRTAVWLFFGISGYVIAHGFVHRRYDFTMPRLAAFFVNRFLRIYPLFAALSLLAFLSLWLTNGEPPIGWRDVGSQLLALQFDHAYVLSGVFWTLGLEVQFYALAPLLAAALCRRRGTLWGGVLFASALTFYISLVSTLGWSYDGRNIVANLPHFLIGMVGARLTVRWSPDVPVWVPFGAGVGLIGCGNWLYHERPGIYWSPAGILIMDAAILSFVLAHARLARQARPSGVIWRALATLGVLSYGIYAWHAYFLTFAPRVSESIPGLLVLSLLAATVTYRVIERPLLRLKR